jgi:hypothetical protein
MKWFQLIMSLLPTVLSTVESVHSDLADHHKQQIAAHIILGAANGAAAVAPQYNDATKAAASAALTVNEAVNTVIDAIGKKEPEAAAAESGPGLHTVAPQ